jgi:transposase
MARPSAELAGGDSELGRLSMAIAILGIDLGKNSCISRGRDLAAWLGLVPRQATTGGKPRLLGITKRGSKYLRKMARIVWALLRYGTTFEPQVIAV